MKVRTSEAVRKPAQKIIRLLNPDGSFWKTIELPLTTWRRVLAVAKTLELTPEDFVNGALADYVARYHRNQREGVSYVR